MPENKYKPSKRDRQRMLSTYTVAAIAVICLGLLCVAFGVSLARARISIEIISARTQCYQGQPRRELFSMQIIPGVGVKVLRDRTIVLQVPSGELQQQPDVVSTGRTRAYALIFCSRVVISAAGDNTTPPTPPTSSWMS